MRNPFKVCSLGLGILALVALSAFSAKAAEAAPVEVMWRDGLFFEASTDHGDVQVRLGGTLHFDTGWGFADLDDDPSGHAHEPRNEYRIRRARVYMEGSLFDSAIFKLQFDIGTLSFADAYVGLQLGPGMLTVGQQWAPFSLQAVGGANTLPLMEGSWVSQLFGPGRLLGLSYRMNLSEDMIGAELGFHRLVPPGTFPLPAATPNQNIWLLGLRFWASLMNDDENSHLHVGLSVNQHFLHEGAKVYNAQGAIMVAPETAGNPTPVVLQRGTMPLDGSTLIGVEAMFATGGLRTMLEFAGDITNPTADGADGDFFFAISATVGYLLNGDGHNYDATRGTVGNPSVDTPFGSDGIGLIEVLMHFDFGDVSDNMDDTPGLSGIQVGLGANWYLNNNMRLMWNFALVSVNDDGTYFLMGLRFQINI